jgi:hypothetical protein
LLGAVVIFGLIGGALFEIANGGRQRALQTQYRDRAVGGVEFDLQTIRLSVTQQFQEQAWVDVANLSKPRPRVPRSSPPRRITRPSRLSPRRTIRFAG